MAGDATIQAAIQSLVQATSRYNDGDVTLGDFRVLGRGRQAAVILPGPLAAQRAGDWSQLRYAWTHYVEVWRRFDGDDYADIVADRQVVMDQLNAYPTLNGTAGITDCTVSQSSDPIYVRPRNAPPDTKPSHVGFRLTVRTVEEVLYAGAGEFA
jgi:hypothetical protein